MVIVNSGTTDNITEIISGTTMANISKNNSEIGADIHEVANYLWKVISPILFVIGVGGNAGIMIILYKMKFWTKMTYVFLFILAVDDTVVLCVGLSRYWIKAVFQLDIREISNFGCVFQLFVIYSSMQLSSWTLVCVTAERYFKTRHPFMYLSHRFSRVLKLVLVISVIVCLSLNLHFFWTNSLVRTGKVYKCTNPTNEYNNFEEKYYVFVDLVMLSVLPFIVMFTMNLLIGKSLHESRVFRRCSISDPKTRRRSIRSSKKLTRMLFFTSIYFLITTLPVSILFVADSFVKDLDNKLTTAKLELAKAVLYLLQFSNYAVNFYIFTEFNDNFRNHLPSFCNKHKSKKRTHSSSSSYTLSSSKDSTMIRSEWISDAVNRNDDINTQNSSSPDIMYEPNNHLSNDFLGSIPHFSELSATCETIPDLKEFNYITEIGFTWKSIVDFDLKSESEVNNN